MGNFAVTGLMVRDGFRFFRTRSFSIFSGASWTSALSIVFYHGPHGPRIDEIVLYAEPSTP
jgi:hypothetical protein